MSDIFRENRPDCSQILENSDTWILNEFDLFKSNDFEVSLSKVDTRNMITEYYMRKIAEIESANNEGPFAQISSCQHKYEIISEIGSGSFGRVYKVKDFLDMKYAVKLIQTESN